MSAHVIFTGVLSIAALSISVWNLMCHRAWRFQLDLLEARLLARIERQANAARRPIPPGSEFFAAIVRRADGSCAKQPEGDAILTDEIVAGIREIVRQEIDACSRRTIP